MPSRAEVVGKLLKVLDSYSGKREEQLAILRLYKEYLDLSTPLQFYLDHHGIRERVRPLLLDGVAGPAPPRGESEREIEEDLEESAEGKLEEKGKSMLGWLKGAFRAFSRALWALYFTALSFSPLWAPGLKGDLFPPSPAEEEVVRRGRYRALSKALGPLLVVEERQRAYLFVEGELRDSYLISTGSGGWGYGVGSHRTPPGLFEARLHRFLGGEVRKDVIAWAEFSLRGLEENRGEAERRGIMVHGVVREDSLGYPISHGCIRIEKRAIEDLLSFPTFYVLVSAGPPTTSLTALEGSAGEFLFYLSSLQRGGR